MTTVDAITQERIDRGFADLLLLIFDAGVSMGMGYPAGRASSASAEALIDTIRERWFQELDVHRSLTRVDEPRLSPEEIPDWLREQGKLLETAPLGPRREL